MSTEVRGVKFERSLSVVEIARRVRREVRDAVKRGALPSGLVVSVRSSAYSMGQSVTVAVRHFAGPVLNPARVFADELRCYEYRARGLYSAELIAVTDALEGMLAAYNRDASDLQTDHWDVHFYGSVDVRVDATSERAALLRSEAFVDLQVAKAAHDDIAPLLDAYDTAHPRHCALN